MDYISTRGAKPVSAGEAILRGIADDGGLYVPSFFPQLTREDFNRMIPMSYPERAAEVLSLFLSDYNKEELHEYANLAYEKFDGDPAPVLKVEDDLFLLELFHGPTFAFKDLALTLMPYLMQAARKKRGEKNKTLILVATSGDTGKAAAEGFKDVSGTEIVVIYPSDGVSELQKLQMKTSEGENVHFLGIKGNFDQAQAIVKKMFGDASVIDRLDKLGYTMSSANSINWGRLVPQIVYFISAYLDILASDEILESEKINFIVPTGNFGNILSGYYSKKMGVPINKLIVASNSNNVLTEFFSTGRYNSKRDFYKTMSPSMDILVSSNLERLIFELFDRDPEKVKKQMGELAKSGEYRVDVALLKEKLSEFVGYYSDEIGTKEGIRLFYDLYDYLLDPHTSVGLNAYYDYIYETKDEIKTVLVSTADPFKFARDVYACLTDKNEINPIEALKRLHDYTLLEIPYELIELDNMPILHDKVVEIVEAEEIVFSFLKDNKI